MTKYFKLIHIGFVVVAWALAAIRDGKISIPEWIDLVYKIAALLGLEISTDRQYREK